MNAKLGSFLVFGWILAVLLVILCAHLFIDRLDDKRDFERLLKEKDVELAKRVSRVDVPTPPGTVAVAHAEGTVDFGPRRKPEPRASQGGAVSSQAPTSREVGKQEVPPAPRETDSGALVSCKALCPLYPEDLGVSCSATLEDTEAGPGWQLYGTARVRLWDDSVVERGPLPVDFLKKPEIRRDFGKVHRFGWSVGPGVGYRVLPERDWAVGVFAVYGFRF